jgi:hypothetical protein
MPTPLPLVTVTLTEPIGHRWVDELIWVDLPDAGPVQAVEVGSGRPLPTQVCGRAVVQGALEPARACVRVTLEPDCQLTLALLPGTRGACRAYPPLPDGAPAAGADEVSLCLAVDDHLAVQVPASQPFQAGEAPGPIVALRPAGHAAWVGQGLWGPCPFAGRLETTVLDRGPLYARWIVRYLVGGQEWATYDCRVVAGEAFVEVRDTSRRGAGMAFRFLLTGEEAPTQWFTHGGGEFGNVTCRPLAEPPDPKGQARAGELIHLDFHSGHFQMSYTWAGLVLADGVAVAVTELHGSTWELPGRNRIRALRLGDGVAWHFPADGGGKAYALVCGPRERYAPAVGLSELCHLRRKFSDLPLEKVRAWVTRWEVPPLPRPVLYPAGTAERWTETLAAWPELAEGYRRLAQAPIGQLGALLPAYLVSGDGAVKDDLLRRTHTALDEAVSHALANGYLRLIIFDGRAMKVILEALDVLRWREEVGGEALTALLRQLAFLAYCFADPDFWPWESAFRPVEDPRSLGAQYAADIGDSICPPNFYTEYYTSFTLMGLACPEHPLAARWVRQGEELFARQLAYDFYESGGYSESANYHAHELVMLTQVAVALRAGGQRDFFTHPRFKATFGFFLQMLTPPVALTAGARQVMTSPTLLNPPQTQAVFVTNWGNSGHDCSGTPLPQTVAVAAGIYAEQDPAYAARLMSAWRAGAQEFVTHYSGFNLLALGRPDLPTVSLDLTSTLVEGLGAVMRAGQGTAQEVMAWVKGGVATHHNCRDEGGLVLYAQGVPLIGDLGYHAEHAGRREGAYETWKHACVTFNGRATSAYLGCERTLPPEYWSSSPHADLLVLNLPVEYLIPEGNAYLDTIPVPRITHRRFLLFIKPDYFVIYDHLPTVAQPSTWWLHALADDVELAASTARFVGRHGVDLHVHLLAPSPAQLTAGVYSVQRFLRVDQPGPGDYLAVVAALPEGATPPMAQYEAATGCLRVRGTWGEDEIRITPDVWQVCLGGDRLADAHGVELA